MKKFVLLFFLFTFYGVRALQAATPDVISLDSLVISLDSVASPTCFDGSDGAVFISIAGGTAPYNFLWSTGDTTEDLSNAVPSYYNVIVTDADNNQVALDSIWLPQPSNPVSAALLLLEQPGCTGQLGSLIVQISGDAAPFDLAWSNGETSDTLTGLPAGTYGLIVTDSNGCAAVYSYTLEPQYPDVALAADGDITCAHPIVQLDGSASLLPLNTVFTWSATDGGQFSAPTDSIVTFTETPGTYALTLTDTLNGCASLAEISVSIDTIHPLADAGPDLLLPCTNTIDTLHATGSTGVAIIYQWIAKAGGNIIAGADSLAPVINHAGTFILTISNSENGCATTDTVIVDGINAPPTLSVDGGILTCFQAEVQLMAQLDTANISFGWTGPNGFASSKLNPIVQDPGNYIFTATDTMTTCTNEATAVVLANNQPPVLTVTGGTITCANSMVELAFTASPSDISFEWTGANGFFSSESNPVVSEAGDYTLTAADTLNGCIATAIATVTLDTLAPVADAGVDATLTCAVTSLQLDGSASSQGNEFSYQWATTDGNIVAGADGLSPTVDAVGTYTLTVTNILNGCTDDDGDVVDENTIAPTASADGGTINCIVTTVELQGNFSVDNTIFVWTDPDGFTSIESNPVVSEPGDYLLTVTDTLNGCSTTVTATVLTDTNQPDLEVSGGIINCSQSQVTLTASSQTPNLTYAWMGANGFASDEQNPVVSEPGDYTVTATDTLNGCSSVLTFTVTIDTVPPIANAGTGFNLDCHVTSGQLDGTASSQGAEFSYTWTTADGNISAGADGLTPTVDAPGTYTLTVTNATNGCTATATVTVTQSLPVTVDVTSSDATCFGYANGEASASVSGGVGNFSYIWSNGSQTATASNLTAGNYSVIVTDESGCSATGAATVGQPAPLNVAITSTAQSFPGTDDGTATADPNGGTSPFSFNWSNGETTATIIDLAPGAYTVTVMDDLGCSTIATANVNAFDCQLTGSITLANVACFGTNSGEATIVLTNEIAPVQYAWSNGDSLATASALAAGTYSVTVSDSTTCSLIFNFEITQPTELVVAELFHTDVFCASDEDGSLTAVVNGGVQPYSLSWSNGGNEPTTNGLGVGTYSLTATDANGCEATLTANIVAMDAVPPVLVLANIVASLDDNGQATVNAELYDDGSFDNCGGIASWAASQSQFDCSEIGTHTVTITITDTNGNETTGTAEVTIEDKTAPTLVCPANISVGACNAAVSFDLPTVSDNCGVDISLLVQTAGLLSGDVFPTGSSTQTFEYTDAAGNTGTCSFEVTVAPELTFGAVLSDASCASACNGAVSLTVNGGLQPVTIAWSNGGDGTGLCAGSYTVSITDADGCNAVLDFIIGEPQPLSIAITTTNPVCPDDLTGAIETVVTGGTPFYNFDWSNGSTDDSITGLGVGVFNLTVTDFQGCSLSETIVLVATDSEAPTLVLQNASASLGANGLVSLNPALFDAGSTDNCGIVEWAIAPTSFDCGSLGDQAVSITATDANGNSITGTATVTISDNIAPMLACPGNVTVGYCNSTAIFNLPVATDNCAVNSALLVQTGGLPSGSNFPSGMTGQSFSYTDPSGNSASCSFNVTVGQAAAITPTFTNATCNDLCNGSATVTITGGLPPFTVLWSNGQNGTTASNLCAGAYSASVTDAAGCLQTLTFNINEPTALQLTVDLVTDDLHGTGVGAVQTSISGGTTPYTYNWTRNGQPLATTQDLANLMAGTYALVVIDGNGCTVSSGNIVVDNLTGTAEARWSEGAILQPNPASERTHIVLQNPLQEQLEILVFDLTGKLVQYRTFEGNSTALSLDLSGLASGVYNVQMQSAGGVTMRRLVVSH